MSIRIGRVLHASYAATAAAATAGSLDREHVATIAAAWQAPTGTGATFAALASGRTVATGDLLDAIADAIADAISDALDTAILKALEAWVYREDPCDRQSPCDDDGPCEAHSQTVAYAWETSATSADDLAASYVLEIAALGVDIPADVLEIARRGAATPDESQALSEAADYADVPAGTYTRWDGGWTLYRITGGPLQYA